MKLVLFGFFRNILKHKDLHLPLKNCEKYIFASEQDFEHSLDKQTPIRKVNQNQLFSKYKNIKQINLYDYDLKKKFFEKEVELMREEFPLPKLLYHPIRTERWLSLFYNVSQSMKLLYNDCFKTLKNDELIVLARADSNITHINEEYIKQRFQKYNVFCTAGFRDPPKYGELKNNSSLLIKHKNVPGNARQIVDNVFVLNKSSMKCFIDLYDNFKIYLKEKYLSPHPNIPAMIHTSPEGIYWYHFNRRSDVRPIYANNQIVRYYFSGYKNDIHKKNTLESSLKDIK